MNNERNDLIDELLLLTDCINNADYCSKSADAYVQGQNAKTIEFVELLNSMKEKSVSEPIKLLKRFNDLTFNLNPDWPIEAHSGKMMELIDIQKQAEKLLKGEANENGK